MKTRKLKSLGLDEAIKVNTLAQAEWFIKKLGWENRPIKICGKYIVKVRDNVYAWQDDCERKILPASDFIKPKKSRLKKLEKRVEALEKAKNNISIGNGLMECKLPFVEEKGEPMIDGTWYKNNLGLFVYKSNEMTYGFYGNIWRDDIVICYSRLGDNTVKATPKEVESALIKEAERRGFKEGVLVNIEKLVPSYNPDMVLKGNIDFSEFKEAGYIWFGKQLIFDNGKWAEIIPNEEETIDWSKSGQLVEFSDKEMPIIVMTTGDKEGQCFSAVVIKSNNISQIGKQSSYWAISDFKPFKGELILKNE